MRILILLVGLWGTKQFEFFPNHLPTKPITLLTEPIESYLEIKSDLLDREKLENLLQSIKTNGKIILKDLGYPAEFSQFEKNIQDIMDIIGDLRLSTYMCMHVVFRLGSPAVDSTLQPV